MQILGTPSIDHIRDVRVHHIHRRSSSGNGAFGMKCITVCCNFCNALSILRRLVSRGRNVGGEGSVLLGHLTDHVFLPPDRVLQVLSIVLALCQLRHDGIFVRNKIVHHGLRLLPFPQALGL